MSKQRYDYDKYDELIDKAAPAGQTELFRAQLYRESQFDPFAENPKTHARGIAQFLPDAWTDATEGKIGYDKAFDPVYAIPAAGRYMDMLLNRYSGGKTEQDEYELALAGYNWGMGHLDKALIDAGYKDGRQSNELEYARVEAFLPKETRDYVSNIERMGGSNSGLWRLVGSGEGQLFYNTFKLTNPDEQNKSSGWKPWDAIKTEFTTYAILIPVWIGFGVMSGVAIYFTIKQSIERPKQGIGAMFVEGLGTTNKMLGDTGKLIKGAIK